MGHGVAFSLRKGRSMKTENDKNKHITFRAPADIIDAVRKFCDENDETPSQFWRKAAKARLASLGKGSQSSYATASVHAARLGGIEKGRECHDGKHCRVKKAS